MFRPRTTTVECPNCLIEFSDIPVHFDEHGDSYDLNTTRCNDDFCTVKLCPCCPQFSCDACGQKFCIEHKTRIDDLNLCPVCTVSVEDLLEPDCECVSIDVDEVDARDCLLHGPHSEMARWQRQREAEDLFAYYSHLDPGVIQ